MNLIKHLIPLFLVFSFTATATSSYPCSKTTAFYSRTEIFYKNQAKIDSKTVYYPTLKRLIDSLFGFSISLQKSQDPFTQKIRTALKLQSLIYLHIVDFARRQYLRSYRPNSSHTSYSSLYIA